MTSATALTTGGKVAAILTLIGDVAKGIVKFLVEIIK